MDLDFWDCFGRKKTLSYNQRNTVYGGLFQTFSRIENEAGSGHKFALIIDGMSLAFALGEHSSILRNLCEKCAAVLCCRMTPLQKAEVCILV